MQKGMHLIYPEYPGTYNLHIFRSDTDCVGMDEETVHRFWIPKLS